jgi:anti-sigma regulatory factor (Ser/Thr protein kinase)
VAATKNSPNERLAGLNLRVGARPAQAFLLRAQLRLWLTEQHATEEEIHDILLATTEAFTNAVMHRRQPHTIAVNVDASLSQGVAQIVIRDHGHWEKPSDLPNTELGLSVMHALMDTVEITADQLGTTVRLHRALGNNGASRTDAQRTKRHALGELLG